MSSVFKSGKSNTLLPSLTGTAAQLTTEFDLISDERKSTLDELTQFIRHKIKAGQEVWLNFICTHNSRRSHISQLWAQAAAHYYGIPDIACFSGGTEATAFNPRAVKAMREAGFNITQKTHGENPVYEVTFADDAAPLKVFSKRYDDPFNPDGDFAAIMTCSHADENCPLVLGASARIALHYNDPKDFDDTPQEATKYWERVREIGREILYAFSRVRN
jgi:arsenate reductase (thioredoxin)